MMDRRPHSSGGIMTESGPPSPFRFVAIPWLILAACVIFSYQAVRPPAAESADSRGEFSAASAMDHVRAIAVAPHPMGTAANAEVRSYIVQYLEGLGVEIELQAITAPGFYGQEASVQVVNVIARIPGSANSGSVALMAHYDTVPETAGANDNSTAVAALLETARVVTTSRSLDNDLLLLFTDGEEPSPQYGSNAFVDNSPAFDDIALVVNFEASGGSGASVLVEVAGSERWLINELGRIDSHPAAFSALTATTRLLGEIGTDFDAFRNAGVAGLHFAYLHGAPIYHTEGDNIESVDAGSLQHHGDHALGIARHFGMLDLSMPQPASSSVFFPVRPFFVTYPGWLAVFIALAGLVGLVGALLRSRSRSTTRSIWPTATTTLVGVAAVVTSTLLWMVIAAARPTLGGTEGYFYFAVLIAAAGTAIARSNRGSNLQPTVGALLPWMALTALTALVGVGFSYLFAWPVLAAAIALWWRSDSVTQQTLRFSLVALVTLVVTVPMIDIFLQLAYPRPGNSDSSIPAVVLLPLLLALMVAQLVRGFWPRELAIEAPAPLPE
jgi:hypothetical protein